MCLPVQMGVIVYIPTPSLNGRSYIVLYVYHSVVNILEVEVYTHTPTHKIQYMVVGIRTSTHIAFHHTIQIPLGV